MEKILKITDLEQGELYTMAGYAVETDKQIIKLMIDNDSSCCEQWGWFWCNDNPQDFIGAELLDVKLTDDALNEAKFKENNVDPSNEWFEGGIMFVNLETDRGTLQFVAYNEHNGYYGHEARVECEQLKHSETL
jgi:hypothetical protein